MSERYRGLYEEAVAAGYAAGNGAKPVPMVVGSAKSLFGSGIDPSKPVYFVPDGACGFAWVKVRPGNSSFAKWLVKNGHAHKAYSGGVDIWISAHNQSVARKEAHAGAMAEVLRAGLAGEKVSVYADSRLD
jgi:hypothetical protein